MKKYFLKSFMLAALVVSVSTVADAQLVIKIRPPMPVVIVRPPMPSPRHVWVEGEYVNNGGRYTYNDGYWEQPKGRYHRRSHGYWKNTKHGYVWVPGRWR